MSAAVRMGVTTRFDLVVIVASMGGLAAVSTVLGGLPAEFEVPILLEQHRVRGSDDAVHARLLQKRTSLPVRVVRHGDPLMTTGVGLVPAGFRLDFDSDQTCLLTESPQAGRALGGDHLFASAARIAGAAVLGVILTGRLHDGTAGARAIKRAGGRVLAEDPNSARAPGMPRSAIATGCVDHVMPVGRIAAALIALTMAPGGAELLAVPTPAWAQLEA